MKDSYRAAPLTTFAKLNICSLYYDFRPNLIRVLVKNFVSLLIHISFSSQVRKIVIFYPRLLQSKPAQLFPSHPPAVDSFLFLTRI